MIADFIQQRFTERYVESVLNSCARNGFSMMAVGCLMIEALESFYQGRYFPYGHKGVDIFNNFFSRHTAFVSFRDYDKPFYKHVHCGILHQAETTGGWFIHRECQPSDPANRVINAEEFIQDIEASLIDYCSQLKKTDWNDPI